MTPKLGFPLFILNLALVSVLGTQYTQTYIYDKIERNNSYSCHIKYQQQIAQHYEKLN